MSGTITSRGYSVLGPFNKMLEFLAWNSLRDSIDRTGRSITWVSSRIFALLSVLDLMSLDDQIPEVLAPAYQSSLTFVRIFMVASYLAGWGIRIFVKACDYMFDQPWVSTSRLCNVADVEKFYYLYSESFVGLETTPLQVIRTLVEAKCAEIYVVKKERMVRPHDAIPCGFFVIQYLSKQGRDAVTAGQKDGRHFDSSDLCVNEATAAGIYIGAMGAPSRTDRRFVVEAFLNRGKEFPPLPVFTRPVTKEGVRLARRRGGMSPLKDPKGKDMPVWHGVIHPSES